MTNAEIVFAKGEFYFDDPFCPIAVRRVAAGSSARHRYDFTATPHRHDFSELVVIASGGGRQMIDDRDYQVAAGDVFLIQGSSVHCFRDRDRVDIVNVQFEPGRLPLPLDWLRRLTGYNVVFEVEPSVRGLQSFKHRLRLDAAGLATVLELTRQLENDLRDTTPGAQAAALARLLELMVFLARSYDAPPGSGRSVPVRVAKVISMLEIEYTRDWTLPDLAHLASSSANSLLRYFRQATGTSPIDYLLQVRLRRAAELLRSGECNVSETAAHCGFSDPNYFTRRFKKAFGVTPARFRHDCDS